MLTLRYLFVCLVLVTPAGADCDFKTGNYIEELKNPANVKSIQIVVPKSGKYFRNALRVISSKSKNIPTSLKRKFKAKVTVSYPFGSCHYKGRVRQNGDWKDHIRLSSGGKLERSLDVKIDDGNVLNSVRFKLLIPKTRGGSKEVFAVSVLKMMGFIAPETFEVPVSVNGSRSLMIFQENSRKELLERNGRREGPIFEGDESLVWGDGRLTENDRLSLSRMENKKWFLKGENSRKISVGAFLSLQEAYVWRSNNASGRYLDPNIFSSKRAEANSQFPSFHFLIQALAAEHALHFHNRKFYFNVFDGAFEPIYYDGMALHGNIKTETVHKPFTKHLIWYAYKTFNAHKYLEQIFTNETRESAELFFIKRSQLPQTKAEKLFATYWRVFEKRAVNLSKKIKLDKNDKRKITFDRSDEITRFIDRASKASVIGSLGIQLNETSDGNYLVGTSNNTSIKVTASELVDIISKNDLNGSRFTLVTAFNARWSTNTKTRQFLDGELVAGGDLKIEINQTQKVILIEQRTSSDWVLFNGVTFNGWTLNFAGLPGKKNPVTNQRFNENGMTGCLNFHNSIFIDTAINVRYGGCEDSLNIVSSVGSLSDLKVSSAFSDAVDMDFANINIASARVEDAFNDCIDVSGGSYRIASASLSGCGDKGISVGESSVLSVGSLEVSKSKIGISSKDLSHVQVSKVSLAETATCLEAKQKKQEFGGASLSVKDFSCQGRIEAGHNSSIRVRGNEF